MNSLAYPCDPNAAEVPEGHYGRLCRGRWQAYDDMLLRGLANQVMMDSKAKRAALSESNSSSLPRKRSNHGNTVSRMYGFTNSIVIDRGNSSLGFVIVLLQLPAMAFFASRAKESSRSFHSPDSAMPCCSFLRDPALDRAFLFRLLRGGIGRHNDPHDPCFIRSPRTGMPLQTLSPHQVVRAVI